MGCLSKSKSLDFYFKLRFQFDSNYGLGLGLVDNLIKKDHKKIDLKSLTYQ